MASTLAVPYDLWENPWIKLRKSFQIDERREDAGMLDYQPSRLPSRSANGSVLASALPPCILGHRLTLFNYHWLVYGAPESSFRNDFYFDILGIFLIRVFFSWFCTHLSWGCWCLKQSKNPTAFALLGMPANMSVSL